MLNFAFENNLKVFLEVFQSDEMFPFETFDKKAVFIASDIIILEIDKEKMKSKKQLEFLNF